LSKSCQKNVKKSCQKAVKKLSKNCQKIRHTWKKPNGAIVEKVRWCNSKKVNGKNKKKKKKKIIGIPGIPGIPGADYVAPGKNKIRIVR
jgi:hypothetical protein